MNFEASPLITPSRITENLTEAFSVVPAWAAQFAPFEEGEDITPTIVVAIGKKHRKGFVLSAMTFGLLCEVTRLGHTIVTNSNFGDKLRVYAKVSYRDAPKDNTPIARLVIGAEFHEAVETIDFASDLRPDNLAKFGAGKPDKEARGLMLKHCERVAREREASGTLPNGFDIGAYMANLKAHLAAIDAEVEQSPQGD
jgi:hypothetical protein